MRRIGIFVTMIGLLGITFCFAEEETITITTYYPSPFGVYKCLRLAPYSNCGKNPGPCGDCDDNSEGTMCYNGDEGLLYICNDPGGWQIASGLWEKENVGDPDDFTDDAIHPREGTWKVGIGTGTDEPQLNLEIKSKGVTAEKIAGIIIQGVGHPTNPGIAFQREGDIYPLVAAVGLADNDCAFSDSAKIGDLTIRPAMGGSVHIGSLVSDTQWPTRVTVTNDGNVGIGIVDPKEKLHVHNKDGNHSIRITESGTGRYAGYHMSAHSETGPGYAVYHDDNDNTFHISYDEILGSTTEHIITATKDGNVGIGTTDPKTKLQVKSDIDTYISLGRDGSETGLHVGRSPIPSAPGYSIYYNFGIDDMAVTTSGTMSLSTHSANPIVMKTTSGSGFYVNVIGDIHCTGKLTSNGGNDPAYVLYDNETRQSIKERVAKEVPEEKLDGAVLFWNGEVERFEVYLPAKGEFRDFVKTVSK